MRLVGIETVRVVHVGARSVVGGVHVLKVMRKLVGPNTHCLLWVLSFFGSSGVVHSGERGGSMGEEWV